MTDENVPAPAPIRSDDQILPFAAWVPIEKSNFVLDLQKKQKNPIFQISMDILQNTNFFRAFTASASLDETRFVLNANLLRDALEITPIDQALHFVSPSSGDAIMDFVDFVNELGYTKAQIPSSLDALGHNYNLTKKGRKDKPYVIPYCRFMKLIIYHLGRTHNIHQRSESPFHLAKEDLRLAKQGGKKKPATPKQPKLTAKEKSSKPAPAPKPKKLRKGKPSLQLIDEDEPNQPEPEPEPEHQGEGEEYDRQTPSTKEASTGPSSQPQDDASANIVRESPSPADAETGADIDKTNSGGDTKILQIGEEQGNEVATEVNLEETTTEIDEGQVGSDPDKTLESRPPPDDDKMDEDLARPDPGESRVALAGPNPEPMHDEFMANVYPKVHESLKFPTDEHVILEDPLSSTGTLSSIKNLDDAFTIGDQFINDKSTKDEPKKLNVEVEVVFMVTVPIYQAPSSVPPLSIPIIDLLPPKPVSSTTQAPIFTTTTTTTTTTLPHPPQQQSTTKSELANLGSRVFTLELRDLPHKIDETVCETVKEAVHVALQASLRDRFRDLPEADIKKMLHQRMFESGSYKSHPEHFALYEALEASMERAQRDEFIAEKNNLQFLSHQPKRHTAHISDLEDTDSSHLPKIKPRPEWLKPILEEDRPTTPEPD
ncbi:hypothetical protein Tco_0347292 [Tanacetum coccineum]